MRAVRRTTTGTIPTVERADRVAVHGDAGSGATDDASLVPLLVWFSPAFPVGAYAYSHGIEWAVEAGDVRDAASLREWLADLIERGGPWSDAVLLSNAHRAVANGDTGRLGEVAELAFALTPTRERRLETSQQGAAFLAAIRAGWPCPGLDRLGEAATRAITLPVAVAMAAAGHSIPLGPTLEAYLTAVAGNLVSAAVRLVPLGQTDGVRVVAASTPLVRRVAARAARADLDQVGGCTLRSDLAAMRHEVQTTRLFRS